MAAALARPGLAAAPAQAVTRSHLWDWGGGPLGLGKYADRTKPVPVHGLGTAAVRQVVSSNGTVLVLLKDGTVWAWGSGPLGNGGGPSVSSQSPLQVTALSGVTAIAATTLLTASDATLSTFYALRGNGTVWAWGDGSTGQLGNGGTTGRYTPGPVTGLSGVTRITTGAGTAFALTSQARVWAWGAGTSGQLGNGSTADSDVPVPVTLAGRVIQIASACGSAYAITGDRRVFAWGVNTFGQLGDGSRATAATPVLVRRVSHASMVVPGCVNAYAIIAGTRSVMAWGEGGSGRWATGRPRPVSTRSPSPASASDHPAQHLLHQRLRRGLRRVRVGLGVRPAGKSRGRHIGEQRGPGEGDQHQRAGYCGRAGQTGEFLITTRVFGGVNTIHHTRIRRQPVELGLLRIRVQRGRGQRWRARPESPYPAGQHRVRHLVRAV